MPPAPISPGAVPHREAGGRCAARAGAQCARRCSSGRCTAYLLLAHRALGSTRCDAAGAARPWRARELVVAITPFASDAAAAGRARAAAAGTFAETSGTYVNLEGRWQSSAGAARPLGEARPAWKVLRVLGNLLDLPGFDYQSSEQVRDELRAPSHRAAQAPRPHAYAGTLRPARGGRSRARVRRCADVPDRCRWCAARRRCSRRARAAAAPRATDGSARVLKLVATCGLRCPPTRTRPCSPLDRRHHGGR